MKYAREITNLPDNPESSLITNEAIEQLIEQSYTNTAEVLSSPNPEGEDLAFAILDDLEKMTGSLNKDILLKSQIAKNTIPRSEERRVGKEC